MINLTIEVRAKAARHDVRAQQLSREIVHNLTSVASSPLNIRTAQLYRLSFDDTFTHPHLETLISQLLIDPVVQEVSITENEQGKINRVADDHKGPPHPPQPPSPLQDVADSLEISYHTIDVFFHPGVTDTLAESVLAGAQLLGIPGLQRVDTGQRYLLDASLSEADVHAITRSLLYNPVIQDYELHLARTPDTISTASKADYTSSPDIQGVSSSIRTFPLSRMSDETLLALSQRGMLALNLDEMHAIQAYFRNEGREPTDVELETLAQTWSEHCSHKTFKATIDYREFDVEGNVLAQERIPGLLRHYLMRATEQVQRPWVISAFRDNAGIIRFTKHMDVAFKVETHNHPSAIEPFGGANTGVGGVIRDVLGVSARPIACTDVLCFGPPDTPPENLPDGVLLPRRIASGVVNGVRDYGNKMGIPTVNGAVLYHEGYIYNPLVFCGCLGMLPHGSHPQQAQPGDLIVVLGGRTGRDGIHGATFSSGEMSSEVIAIAGSAVQIGAPITEKKVADVVLAARERRLYHAITDCGAGGFSSAIGEMGAEIGARVELAKAPLKYAGLAPWEIWLSEAQERMVLAVPRKHVEELRAICAIEEVEASVLGTFSNDSRLIVTYQNQIVANLDMAFLHNGCPARTLDAVWTNHTYPTEPTGPSVSDALMNRRSTFVRTANSSGNGVTRADKSAMATINRGPTGHPNRPPDSLQTALLTLLSHPTIASKEEVVRRYDHEVQGATVLKPLVGRAGNGPGDAAVLQPILDWATHANTGAAIVLANGINPLYGRIDPYQMALNAVDEALRNLTAVGGDIEHTAILDNFCWGNPNDPQQLGMLVRAVQGCYDAAVGFGTPFISGKDSLNNEYRSGEQRLPVIPTLLISAVGIIDDAAETIDMSLKAPGNLLYQIGATRNELAASHYAEIQPLAVKLAQQTSLPQVNIAYARNLMNALGKAIRHGLVQSCHDLSEGGLAIAAAEMSLAALLGMTIDVSNVQIGNSRAEGNRAEASSALPEHPLLSSQSYDIITLFSESPSRFLVEITAEQQAAFEAYMHEQGVQDICYIGTVTDKPRFIVRNGEKILFDVTVEMLQLAWKGKQV